jgi:gallate dioxygenase
MAKIIGGIGVSHTPTIGYAVDKDLRQDAAWQPVFQNFGMVRDWLEEKKPDVLLVIYNDHVTSFFFDHYSAFALGVGDAYEPADEGGGARDLPSIRGHAELARHIGTSLMADEFDLAFFRNRPLDHGCFSPLSILNFQAGEWIRPIVPLQVGVLQFPIPTARRCFRLGQALRRAIASFPADLKVAIVGTGGLSHQVHGERAGFNNPEWDHEFLNRLVDDPASLTEMTHADYVIKGGAEGVEIIMWLIMRGALGESVRKVQQSYYLPSMTAIATLILEPDEIAGLAPLTRPSQLAGIETLEGTYPFSLERLASAYELNAFLHKLVDADWRQRFQEQPEQMIKEAGLSEGDRDLILSRDWRGLIRRGVTFFVLEKLGAATGVSNLDIYAGMKGITTAEMLKTRNTQITYSVAGGTK